MVVQAKRPEILDRLPVEPVDLLVRRGKLGRPLLPLPLERIERELTAQVVAAVERLERLVAADEHVVTARVPGLARSERDLEGDAAIGVVGRRAAVRQAKDERPAEVAVRVAHAQLAALLVPFALDAPAAHELVGFHLEDVGEIRSGRDLEVEPRLASPVVLDVEILVDALADGAADREPQLAGGDIAALGRERRVRQVDARGVVRDRARAQPHPSLAVGEDGVIAEKARVLGEDALLAVRRDLPAEIGDHERPALADRQDGRPDADLDRHPRAMGRAAPLVNRGPPRVADAPARAVAWRSTRCATVRGSRQR